MDQFTLAAIGRLCVELTLQREQLITQVEQLKQQLKGETPQVTPQVTPQEPVAT